MSCLYVLEINPLSAPLFPSIFFHSEGVGWILQMDQATPRVRESASRSVVSDSLRPHRLYSPRKSPGQNIGVGSLSLLLGIFPTQGSHPALPHCWQVLYQLSHKGSPRILEWVAYPFSRGSSRPRNWTRVSCTAGGFFTSELPGKGSISIWHLSARITLGHSGLMVCCGIKKKNKHPIKPITHILQTVLRRNRFHHLIPVSLLWRLPQRGSTWGLSPKRKILDGVLPSPIHPAHSFFFFL